MFNLRVMLGMFRRDLAEPVGDLSYFAYRVVDDVDGYYEEIKAKDSATF